MNTLKDEERFSRKSDRFDDDEAYTDILSALFALDEKRNHQKQNILASSRHPTLGEVALDIERAEVLPQGSVFGLHKLENTDHLFIRYTEERSPYIQEMKRRFEILNSAGERVLFAVEESNILTSAFSYSTLHDFDFRFMDSNTGVEAFKLVSRARLFGILGTKLKVLKDDVLMGEIFQSGEYGSTVFKIQSRTGRLRFVIKPTEEYVEGIRPSFFQRLRADEDIDINFPDEFNIFSADESVLIGRIMGVWRKQEKFLEHIQDSEDTESRDEALSGSSTSSDEDEIRIDESDENESVLVEEATSFTSVTSSVVTADGPSMNDFLMSESRESGKKEIERVSSISLMPSTSTRSYLESSHRGNQKDEDRTFKRERYGHFCEVMKKNTMNWEWYFEGEHFGAEFTVQLGSITRAMIVSVILLQYFRIHFDRHHRRKGSRLLYKKNFKRWCIFTGIAALVSLLLIGIDINRDRAPW